MGMAANYGNTRVKFLKSWQGYNPGDLAGFAPSVASRLVNEGVAAFDKIEKPAVTPVTKTPALNPKPKKKNGRKSRKQKKVEKVEQLSVLKAGIYTKEDLDTAIRNTASGKE